MACLAVDRNSCRALVQSFAVEISDVTYKRSVLVVHQNHSTLGDGNVNIVFSIYGHSGRSLQAAALPANNAEGGFFLWVQYMYGWNARIAKDDAVPGVCGQVLRCPQHAGPAVNEGNNGIARATRKGMHFRQSGCVPRWLYIVHDPHVGRKHPRRNGTLSCGLLRRTFG